MALHVWLVLNVTSAQTICHFMTDCRKRKPAEDVEDTANDEAVRTLYLRNYLEHMINLYEIINLKKSEQKDDLRCSTPRILSSDSIDVGL